MATISISGISGSGCKVQLTGLDTSYAGTDRTCEWYFRAGEWPNVTEGLYDEHFNTTISGAPSESNIWTVSTLTANTDYCVYCIVRNSSQMLATLRKEFTTTSEPAQTASITFPDITEDSCLVQIVGLQTSYTGGDRTCKWYFKAGSDPTATDYDVTFEETIAGAPESSDVWTVSGLTAGTAYHCRCEIYNGTQFLTALESSFSTACTSTAPGIARVVAQQGMNGDERGEKRIYVLWYVNNAIGGTYEIYVNGTLRVSQTVEAIWGDMYLSVNSFGTYSVLFKVKKGGQTVSKTVNANILDLDAADLTPTFNYVRYGYKKLILYWYGTDYTDYYTLRLTGSDENHIVEKYSEQEYTFDDLDFCGEYDFYVTCHHVCNDGSIRSGIETLLTTCMVRPSPPTLLLSQSGGYLTVAYGVREASYVDEFVFLLYCGDDTNYTEKMVVQNPDTTNRNPSGTCTFTTQLTAGTYRVQAYTSYKTWRGYTEDNTYAKAQLSFGQLPSVWSWDESNGSGTDAQTRAAHVAVSGKGYTADFSYFVWNDMAAGVKEVLDYIGEAWDAVYATYDNTRMLASDKELSAARFNSLRRNIGNHASTGIAEQAQKDIVYGSYFITLTECLNSWIQSIN